MIHVCSVVLVYYKSAQAAIFTVMLTDLEILCLLFKGTFVLLAVAC